MAQSETDSCLATSDSLCRFVVVNMETKVPVRDILIYTDDKQEARSRWDGTFSLRRGFERIMFAHPNYEKRIMLKDEIDGDTIYLLPNLFALNEVVVYGHRRDISSRLHLGMNKVDAQLAHPIPQGFNLLGLLSLGYDAIWGKKIRHRKATKKQKQKMIIDNY